jgi:hypothetical protein
MSVEVRPEEPSPPDPGPARKKKFTLKFVIAQSLIMAVVLGYLNHITHKGQRMRTTRQNVLDWTFKIVRDNPSLVLAGHSSEGGEDLLGAWSHVEGTLKTPAGRLIAISFTSRDRLFDKSDGPDHLVLTAEGRSVTWPIEVIERAQKVDLKTEFPEAFR